MKKTVSKETKEEKRERLRKAGQIGGKRSKGGGRPKLQELTEKQLKQRQYDENKKNKLTERMFIVLLIMLFSKKMD